MSALLADKEREFQENEFTLPRPRGGPLKPDAIYTHKRKPVQRPRGLTRPPSEIKKRFRPGTHVVTTGVAAFILGIGITELKRREHDGVFYGAVFDTKGRAWYDEENLRRIAGDIMHSRQMDRPVILPPSRKEARALKKKEKAPPGPVTKRGYDAELAARVFVELQKNVPIAQIIIEQKVHPEDALAIEDAYARVMGGFMMTRSHLADLAHLPMNGAWPPRNAAEMVFIIRSVMEKELQRCVKCQRGYARLCASCAPAPSAKTSNGVTTTEPKVEPASHAHAPAHEPQEQVEQAAAGNEIKTEAV